MTENTTTAWQILREIQIGAWKRGWIAKDKEGNIRLLVSMDRQFDPTTQAKDKMEKNDGETTLSDGKLHEVEYQEECKSFLERIEYFANVDHPHIANLYDVQRNDEGEPTLVMEYSFGLPITHALYAASTISFLAHFKQVFEAVAHIHSLGLLMLNVKPRLFVTDATKGTTKFMGIWNVHTPKDLEHHIYEINPVYAAPELILHKEATVCSDLFSVGAIMLEAWRGYGAGPIFNERLNAGASLSKLQKAIEEERLPPWTFFRRQVSVDADDVPLELTAFLEKLVAKDPKERGFKTVREVINYMVDTWPEIAEPRSSLFADVMRTVRL